MVSAMLLNISLQSVAKVRAAAESVAETGAESKTGIDVENNAESGRQTINKGVNSFNSFNPQSLLTQYC